MDRPKQALTDGAGGCWVASDEDLQHISADGARPGPRDKPSGWRRVVLDQQYCQPGGRGRLVCRSPDGNVVEVFLPFGNITSADTLVLQDTRALVVYPGAIALWWLDGTSPLPPPPDEAGGTPEWPVKRILTSLCVGLGADGTPWVSAWVDNSLELWLPERRFVLQVPWTLSGDGSVVEVADGQAWVIDRDHIARFDIRGDQAVLVLAEPIDTARFNAEWAQRVWSGAASLSLVHVDEDGAVRFLAAGVGPSGVVLVEALWPGT